MASLIGLAMMTVRKSPLVLEILKSEHSYSEKRVEKLLEKVRLEIQYGVSALTKRPENNTQNWGRTYSLLFLLHDLRSKRYEIEKNKREKSAIDLKIQGLIEVIEKAQRHEGGWSYINNTKKEEYPSFVHLTAPTVHALALAQQQGFIFNKKVLRKAKRCLRRATKLVYESLLNEDEYVQVASYLAHGYVSNQRGTIGRNSAAFSALYLVDEKMDLKNIQYSTELFIKFSHLLEAERNSGYKLKKDGGSWHNTDSYSIAPYYFSYGFAYTSSAYELIEHENDEIRKTLDSSLIASQNRDGSFSEKIGMLILEHYKSHPTAFAILSLLAPIDTPLTPERKQ